MASSVSVAIAVSLSSVTAFALLMATFGFLLSHNIFSNFKAMLCLLFFKQNNRIAKCFYSSCKRVFTKTFISYSGLGSAGGLRDLRSYLIFLFVLILKGGIVLGVGLVCVYFTSAVQDGTDTKRLLTIVFSSVVICLWVFVLVSDALQRPYVLGIVRNCCYPKSAGHIGGSAPRRRILHYFSLPRRVVVYFGESW